MKEMVRDPLGLSVVTLKLETDETFLSGLLDSLFGPENQSNTPLKQQTTQLRSCEQWRPDRSHEDQRHLHHALALLGCQENGRIGSSLSIVRASAFQQRRKRL